MNFKDDFTIRRLECKHKELEKRVWDKLHPKTKDDDEKVSNFQSHPKPLHSDASAASIIDRTSVVNFTSAGNDWRFKEREDRKQKAHSIRKKLHEKLYQTNHTIINLNSENIGDNYNVPTRRYDRNEEHSVKNSSVVSSRSEFSDSSFGNGNAKYQPTIGRLRRNVPHRQTSAVILKSSSMHNSHRSMTNTVFEKKFKTIVEKSLHTISDIRLLIEKGITPPDGEGDFTRRAVRVKEFSNRFSRNYLYPVARQLHDLNNSNNKYQNTCGILYQKLLSVYQTIFHGLQAYQNHLPTSVGNCSSDKLKILMENMLELGCIHGQFVEEPDDNGNRDFIDTFKLHAELTLQKIQDYFENMSTVSVLKSNNTKISLSHYAVHGRKGKNTPKKQNPKKNTLDKRLAMYAVSPSFRKDPQWKKAVETLAKKKFNVKSKYKTATYKHRPPIQKEPQILTLPINKFKLYQKKASGNLQNTPLFPTAMNEDNIKTMVELIDEENGNETKKENVENKGKCENDEKVSNNEILVKLLKLAIHNKNDPAKINESDGTNLTEIMDCLTKENNTDFLKKILDEVTKKDSNDEINKLTLEIVKSQSSIVENGEKKRKEPKITISGEKNARLICITDENSPIQSDNEEIPEDDVCQCDKIEPQKVIVSTSETQTDINSNQKEGKISKSAQKTQMKKGSTIRISRLPKQGRDLAVLQKNYAVNIIQYKLDFSRHCKNDPMYKKSSVCQPWVLMGKISDKLLNQSLLAVAREIEVNDVVDTIYQSELQL